MMENDHRMTRRGLLALGASTLAIPSPRPVLAKSAGAAARIVISLDLEMSRQYPRPTDLHWDYEKGNLDQATKDYAVEAAHLVKESGGRIHFFALGRTMEQENLEWLHQLAKDGHKIGNHSYDHVNIKATRGDDIQFRFRRAPWLIADKPAKEVIRSNIELAKVAIKTRIGVDTTGFRTPGGFNDGLRDRPDLQEMLLSQGYRWVSSLYPPHPYGMQASEDVLRGIVDAQKLAQPFMYASGLVELPMSPISDVTAFRAGRWTLPSFLEATKRSLESTIRNGSVFDFLAHPSCLAWTDPKFETIHLICKMVKEAAGAALMTDLDSVASFVRADALKSGVVKPPRETGSPR